MWFIHTTFGYIPKRIKVNSLQRYFYIHAYHSSIHNSPVLSSDQYIFINIYIYKMGVLYSPLRKMKLCLLLENEWNWIII
jgi:hypothetical protein